MKRTKAGPKATGRPKRKGRKTLKDPSDQADTSVRFVTESEAKKEYTCPGCMRQIFKGQGHVVAVPDSAPDLRRHWHKGCWDTRS